MTQAIIKLWELVLKEKDRQKKEKQNGNSNLQDAKQRVSHS